jgi:DNA helicase-2/ATP-dependent DNA helicase PcrA
VIDQTTFENGIVKDLGRDITSDIGQLEAIRAPKSESLFIVAGPGSGKTTVIALRVLKLIFVDDMDPVNIIATTFTRKAASELRSRILGWGDQLRRIFLCDPSQKSVWPWLRKLNLNRITTGTLDSIIEDTLQVYRAPGTQSPNTIEGFVAASLMTRAGLFTNGRYKSTALRNCISSITRNSYGLNVASMSTTLQEINDRISHDLVNVKSFRKKFKRPGLRVMLDAIDDYNRVLESSFLADFPMLERLFLQKLHDGNLTSFLSGIKFVLVDEYQDTNLLQEKIYFSLARAAIDNGGSMAVVGDDDQSLYRFRGATVDLFQSFENNAKNSLALSLKKVYLSKNYRSNPGIVNHINDFANLDPKYQKVRAKNKPRITQARANCTDIPVLGMFRDDIGTLAHDLAKFIDKVTRTGGFRVKSSHGKFLNIAIDPEGGIGDIAVLCSSPAEVSGQRERLALLLRRELERLPRKIAVFNPRGRRLNEVPSVQILCGLMLECIDPGGKIQRRTQKLPVDIFDILSFWRATARGFVKASMTSKSAPSLGQFVKLWQTRKPSQKGKWGKREVSLLDLLYNLVTWIPVMQHDVENLVYLEAIARTITDSGFSSKYAGQIVFDPKMPALEGKSIKAALWSIFVPLASGVVDIDEELLETLPTDRLNIMSIHQAKGLEFPLVIVDVGSDFKINHPSQAFKRFPNKVQGPCALEDCLRPFSPLKKPKRSGIDREFDDLTRQFYVAFSRAQDVLLLVGLNSVKNGIPNVATGWNRNGEWIWGSGLPNLIHI